MGKLLKTLNSDTFRTVVVDPPWTPTLHANNIRRYTVDKSGPQKHYKTLSVDEIVSLKPNLEEQCHLYIWAISQHVDWAYLVAQSWGVCPVILFTWCKPGLGTGRFQCNTEHILVCRGGPKVGNGFGAPGTPKFGAATNGTHFDWPRRRHSQKPDEFFRLVETISPGPYLEMYARKKRPGWSAWGNEVS